MKSINDNSDGNKLKSSNAASKCLIFVLDGEDYGIDISKIREIIGATAVTPVPNIPPYMKGVINLRGKVIPVADLRLRFGIPAADGDDRACIVVAEVDRGGDTLPMGLMVDSVSEMISIRPEDIEAAPSFGSHTDTDFILGIAKAGNDVKILLDIDRVLAGDELTTVRDAA